MIGMSESWIIPIGIVVLTVGAMELLAFAVHKYVMHGPGWGWHRSHHEPRTGWFEKNDLYGLVFAGISLLLFSVAADAWPLLWWVGAGMALYGLLYAFVHDGLVHRRFPFVGAPRSGYMKRLVQAHRMHHAVKGRTGAVSFGFLYAPPVTKLKRQLKASETAE
jgi:beta-carotene 3-hydroxylase